MSDQVITAGRGKGKGEETFGVADLEYNLITTMSNLLQGQEVLERYAQDAEQAGDAECATLFREVRENNRRSAQQMRNALGRHLSGGK